MGGYLGECAAGEAWIPLNFCLREGWIIETYLVRFLNFALYRLGEGACHAAPQGIR